MANNGVIYKITNPNNKIYIGKSTNFNSRLYCYKNLRCTAQRHLYNSLKKYGYENHIIEIIEECQTPEELFNREIYHIDKFDSYKDGMNLTKGGDGNSNLDVSGKNNPMYGKHHSIETKDLMSKSKKGKPINFPNEELERRRKFMTGNKYGTGIIKTPDTIDRSKKTRMLNVFKKRGHILQLNDSGNVIKKWLPSYKSISIYLDCDPSTIRRAIKYKIKRLGYYWRFEHE